MSVNHIQGSVQGGVEVCVVSVGMHFWGRDQVVELLGFANYMVVRHLPHYNVVGENVEKGDTKEKLWH